MFILQNKFGSILTAQGEFVAARFVGPGGYKPKIWKTRSGAERYGAQRWGCFRKDHLTVIELDDKGAPIKAA